jgi:hypothetical protein
MDGKTKTRHDRWVERTDAAYRRMFEGKSEEELVTLTQRESMAVLIAKELAAFLLEEQVALDAAAKPASPEAACCPKCGQPGTSAIQKEDELPERRVTTRAGEIGVRRQRWRCAKCRILFFSARRKARSGDGRLQSGAHPEGGSAGGEVAVVRGSERRFA